MKRRLLSLAAALALCFSLAGCTLSTPSTVGSIGTVEIPSGLYLLAQYNAYQQAASYAGEGQTPEKTAAFLKEKITPDEGSEQTVADYVAAETLKTLQTYAATEERFAALGGELTDEQKAAADSYAQQLMDSYGKTYAANGIGLETLKSYQQYLQKADALVEMVYGKDGETPVSDEELTRYCNSSLYYSTYLTIPLYNSGTYAYADDDQKAEMLKKAEELVARYQADYADAQGVSAIMGFYQTLSEGVKEIYDVIDDSYDPSSLSSEIQTQLLTLDSLEGYFSDEALAAIGKLSFNEAVACKYSDHALILLLRTDPLQSGSLDDLRSTLLADMKAEALDAELAGAGAALPNSLTNTAKFPAKKIKSE